MEYQKRQVEKLGVKIKLNRELNANSTELSESDQIIVALGAEPFKPSIEGIECGNILDVLEAHQGAKMGDKIIVCGGGLSGCDFALEQAMEGKNVTIIEMRDKIAFDALDMNRLSLSKKLDEYKVKIMTNTKVVKFDNGEIFVEDKSGKEQRLSADTIISAFGMKSRNELAKEIADKYPRAKIIGDCDNVAQVGEAVRSGFFAAWGTL